MSTSASLPQRRRERALEADELLTSLLAEAVGGDGDQGLALVAVGGYGRSELSPHSDLDVVLLHAPDVPEARVGEVAEAIWYPLWDRGVALDHAVRDTAGMRVAASQDHRAAMGMLDARPVAGDAALARTLRSEVLSDWRRGARRRLPEVRTAQQARIERAGWLAHTAVPDLKESGGGLRDGVVLRALVATWLVDVPHAEVEALRSELLDLRDALHEVTGRRTDKLLPDHVPDVAAMLGTRPEELDLRARGLGRRLAHLGALTWARVDDVLAPAPARRTISATGPVVTPLADGVAELDGEVIVTRAADPAGDPEVALRAAATAARAGLPLGSSTASRLARTLADLPEPWSPTARRQLVDLLTAGPGLVRVWDELDFAGVVDRWLPEWAEVRLRGSASPVHRFTIDRHSLETCVTAVEVRRDVDRPDLLAVAALLHDIGKGRPGDHSDVGAPMAVDIATRWGFSADDAHTVGRLVQWHLLLPTVATRRDIEDPSTAANVAEIVQTRGFLDLLAALTQADARATAPAAWSSWRRGLVLGLVAKVREQLDDAVETPAAESYEGWPPEVPRPDMDGPPPNRPQVSVQEHRGGSLLTVLAGDRPGLMADVAGGLALQGLAVRSVRMVTHGACAASLWEVNRPDLHAEAVRERLTPVLAGEVDLAARLALRPVEGATARATLLEQRSATATLLEVRAHDRRGLVWAVCRTIAARGHSIRSAHLSTYGDEARDVFYVVDADGAPLGESAAAAVRDAVDAALT